MKQLDRINCNNELYDILSPKIVGDYIETIGKGCQNPDGYTSDSTFVAYEDDTQKLFRATAPIAQGSQIVVGTNVEHTNLSELLKNAGDDSFSDLSDVQFAELTNNDIPVYDAEEEKWKNSDALATMSGQISSQNTAIANEVETRAKLGAHNLLNLKNPTRTNGGVTFTVSSGAIALANSATSDAYLIASQSFGDNTYKSFLKAGTYKLNGDSHFSDDLYAYLYYDNPNTSTVQTIVAAKSSNDAEFTLPADGYVLLNMFVKSGQSTGFTYKPQIRLMSDPSTDYAPYAMTNRELTEDLNGNYIYEGYTDVSIEPDTTSETISTALVKLLNAGNTFLGTLDHDNEFAVLEQLKLGNYATMKAANYEEKKYNSGASTTFLGMAFTDNYGSIWTYLVSFSSTPKVTRYKVTSSGLTNSVQIEGDSATAMGTFTLRFKKYRKIV